MSDPSAPPTPSISESTVGAAVDAALASIGSAAGVAQLKQARTEHLGDASLLAKLNSTLRDVAPADKAALGKLVGQARSQVNEAYTVRESELFAAEETARLAAEAVDVTAVASRGRPGARHPLNLLQEYIADVFVGMGWEVAEGPELENEWFNFDALNFDEDHPARAMQDTFFVAPIDSHLVLRTQTSPVQIRSLLTRELPVYVISPGKVFRTDELDATHTPVFHQVEGIAVDRGLTMAHLRGTLEHFARIMFGRDPYPAASGLIVTAESAGCNALGCARITFSAPPPFSATNASPGFRFVASRMEEARRLPPSNSRTTPLFSP